MTDANKKASTMSIDLVKFMVVAPPFRVFKQLPPGQYDTVCRCYQMKIFSQPFVPADDRTKSIDSKIR